MIYSLLCGYEFNSLSFINHKHIQNPIIIGLFCGGDMGHMEVNGLNLNITVYLFMETE